MRTEYTQEEIDDAIVLGVKFLDEFFPDWHNKIDINELDMMDPKWSICGQVSKDSSWPNFQNMYVAWAGVDPNTAEENVFCAFDDTWIEVIQSRIPSTEE